MTSDFQGMNYEQASRAGMALIEKAARNGAWMDLPEKLADLRDIMMRRLPHRPTAADRVEHLRAYTEARDAHEAAREAVRPAV